MKRKLIFIGLTSRPLPLHRISVGDLDQDSGVTLYHVGGARESWHAWHFELGLVNQPERLG